MTTGEGDAGAGQAVAGQAPSDVPVLVSVDDGRSEGPASVREGSGLGSAGVPGEGQDESASVNDNATAQSKGRNRALNLLHTLRSAVHDDRNYRQEPRGTTFRGWAIGIHAGERNFILTVLVMLAQVAAPMILTYWTYDRLGQDKAYLVYMDDFVEHADHFYHRLFLQGFGTLLLCIIYVNNDAVVHNMEYENSRLQELFGHHLSSVWMLAEAFAVSVCVMGIAWAAPYMLWLAEDVKEIILDAFGLLFLIEMHRYGHMVTYGVNPDDFDSIVAGKAQEVRARGPSFRTYAGFTNSFEGSFWWNGGVHFCFTRIVNLLCASFSIPAFAALQMLNMERDDDRKTYERVRTGSSAHHSRLPQYPLTHPWKDYLFFVLMAIIMIPVIGWRIHKWTTQRTRDCKSFLYYVVLFRDHDPREHLIVTIP